MESFFAAAKKLKYDGPNELIARAGDTLSTDFIERLRRMADADQNGASDGGGQLLPTGDPLPAPGVRAEIAEHIARVKQQGFTVIENVIPPELVAAVREDVVEAVRTIKAEWDALGETSWKQHPPGAPPGISQLAHLPSLAPYFGDERMLGVARGLLDPHLRIAQCEAVGGTIRQPDDNRPLFRAWHSDWPHDLTAGPHSGSIAQPFPDVTMALSTVWYLNDASPESGGTWVVPHSHRDLRNPRGVLDAIDENAPIPGEVQITAPAGSVYVQDTRCWHSIAANPGPIARIGVVVIYAPWWLNLEFSRGQTGFAGANAARVPRASFAQLPASVQELVRHRAEGEADEIADAKWFVSAASQLKKRPPNNDRVRVDPGN